ncbi:DUF2507 domain-containing protein [Salimicrobium sp. PL1-032A]|uniref:DUF2507 domain-containing protein n=1 Tax=Salimicrobium sp. PL1-032A TaxID=3095364 RepID=UPI0032607D18
MQNTSRFTIENIESMITTGAGFDILRYFTLPDLLGDDAERILYIMGRNIARNSDIQTTEDVTRFVHHFGWGELTEMKKSKHERTFSLSGSVIEKRLSQEIFDINMKLEAGFLAECFSSIEGKLSECREEMDRKHQRILLTVYHL